MGTTLDAIRQNANARSKQENVTRKNIHKLSTEYAQIVLQVKLLYGEMDREEESHYATHVV